MGVLSPSASLDENYFLCEQQIKNLKLVINKKWLSKFISINLSIKER